MEAALYDPDDGFYARGPRIGRGGAFATVPTLVPLFTRGAGARSARALGVARAAGAVHGLRGRAGRRHAGRRASPRRSPICRSSSCSASAPRGSRRSSGHGCRRRRHVAARRARARRRARSSRTRCTTRARPTRCAGPTSCSSAVDDARALRLERGGACARTTLRGSSSASGAAPAAGLELQVSPAQAELQTQLAERSARGALYVFDYGEAGPERYLRRVPRLRTYLGGRPGGDPLAAPGTQDITVDVDFGALRAAGEAAGLRTVLDEPQPAWLRRHGALEQAESLPPNERGAALARGADARRRRGRELPGARAGASA